MCCNNFLTLLTAVFSDLVYFIATLLFGCSTDVVRRTSAPDFHDRKKKSNYLSANQKQFLTFYCKWELKLTLTNACIFHEIFYTSNYNHNSFERN